jgi:glycosyltransferase involved in cell wall biosynthesis
MGTVLYIVNSITQENIPIELADRLDEWYRVIILSLYDNNRQAIKKAKDCGLQIEVKGIGLGSKLNLFKYLHLYRTIRSIRPDIIHTHHTYSGFLGALFGRLSKNTRLVMTVHTDVNSMSRVQRFFRKVVLGIYDAVVFNSENTKRSFFDMFGRRTDNLYHTTVIYNGVDVAKVTAFRFSKIREKYNIKRDDFVICTVGRLVPQKDQMTLLKAFKIFNKSVPESKLIAVGDGPLINRLRTFCIESGIIKNTIFTGLLARENVYRVLNSIDLFVISSVFEGFCNAMVEAMIAEKPIIYSDIPPLPEVIGEGNGIAFTQGEYHELAKTMVDLYNDKALRDNLAHRARLYAVERYSLDRCVKEYADFYSELLKHDSKD